jgi:hypothetical protein
LLPSSCWFVAWFTFRFWRWIWHVPSKRRLTFNGLHGVIPKNIVFLIFLYVVEEITQLDPYI